LVPGGRRRRRATGRRGGTDGRGQRPRHVDRGLHPDRPDRPADRRDRHAGEVVRPDRPVGPRPGAAGGGRGPRPAALRRLPTPPDRTDLQSGGTATLVKSSGRTDLSVRVTGLPAGAEYPAHLHDGACHDHGGHYMHDPDGPMAPPNEIWASSSSDPQGGLVPNQQGVAIGSGGAAWVARQQPLSIMVHEPELPGLPIACADFSAYEALARVVLAADDGEGSGVETLEYSLDGGDWVAYSGAVEVSAPGDHTVAFRATDAAGNTSEAGELTFAVAGDDEPVEVTPEAVTFTDEEGPEDDTFTVPAVEGVEYLVDGEVVAAGTYPGSGTVTVTARALEGYELADGATTEWSHTFSTGGGTPTDPLAGLQQLGQSLEGYIASG